MNSKHIKLIRNMILICTPIMFFFQRDLSLSFLFSLDNRWFLLYWLFAPALIWFLNEGDSDTSVSAENKADTEGQIEKAGIPTELQLMAMTKADIKDEASRLGIYVSVNDTKQEMISSFMGQTTRLKEASTPEEELKKNKVNESLPLIDIDLLYVLGMIVIAIVMLYFWIEGKYSGEDSINLGIIWGIGLSLIYHFWNDFLRK